MQIPPKGDFLLAKLLSDALDGKDLNLDSLIKLGIEKEDFDKVLELISTKKVSVMLGVGPQKYKGVQRFFMR